MKELYDFQCSQRSRLRELRMDVNITGDILDVNNNETEINDVRIFATSYILYEMGEFFFA